MHHLPLQLCPEVFEMSLGSVLRGMRTRFAGNSFKQIAKKVLISPKNVTENWETDKTQPKVGDLFTYVRLLAQSAASMNLSSEFEAAR